jgi:tRNA splicing ligase
LLLPKANYNNDLQILNAIRKKMAELIPRINEDDAKVLIKKDRW